jgi:hypothetical protein
LQWQQPLEEYSEHAELLQQAIEPRNTLKQIGLREPSGQTHSQCGDAAKRVELAVSQTVTTDNRRLFEGQTENRTPRNWEE